jgi:tetratricopeptide (TPR) repeat protein
MKRALLASLSALLVAMPAAPQQRPSKQWLRLTGANFEIFTTGSERDGRDLMKVFEQIRGFFERASPVPLLEQFPVRIIAFGSPEEFRPYSPHALASAYATSNRRTDYIVMQDATPQSYGLAVHEYMHLLVNHSGLRLPLWLNEGWADVYSTLRPVRDGVAVGDLIPERMQTLETQKWLGFDELTSVTKDSPNYSEANRVGIFYAESWALAHMLFLSPEYGPGFPKFLIALHRGSTADEAARTAWGRSPDQISQDLRNYFGRKKLYGRIFEAPMGKSERGLALAKLDSFDSRLMLADLKTAIGRMTEARSDYEALAKERPDSPEVTVSMGYLDWGEHNLTATREEFEKAFAAGDDDPRMCFELGSLERAAHEPEKAIAAFERALHTRPDYADALLQLGLMRVAVGQYSGAIEALKSIPRVSPTHATPLFSALAYSYFETGDLDKARSDALTAKKWAVDPKETNGVDSLLTLIDARARSRFAPHPGEKTERIEGLLQAVDCSQGHTRLVVQSGQGSRAFELPEANAVEFTHSTGGGGLQLTCGPQNPIHLAVGYATETGVVRRLEF